MLTSRLLSLLFSFLLLSVLSCAQSKSDPIKLSTPGMITAFRINTDSTNAIISGNSISLLVPTGTNLSSLVASFNYSGAGVQVNGTPQISGVTANNFSNPVVYTALGANEGKRDYTVTLQTTNSDIFPPRVSSVTATSDPVNKTANVRVYYTDFGSGFSYGSVVFCGPTYFNDPNSGGHRLTGSLTNRGAYADVTLQLSVYNESGLWQVCGISLADVTGNFIYYSANVSKNSGQTYFLSNGLDSGIPVGGQVNVTGTTPDFTAPTISSITVSPGLLSSFPGFITAKIYFLESGSGFASGFATFCSPGSMNSTGNARVSASLTNAGSYAQATMTFYNYHASGNWAICAVELTDVIGNKSSYTFTPSISSANLTLNGANSGIPLGGPMNIQSTAPDTTAPILNSITLTPSSVSSYPATVTVRVNYTETNGFFSGPSILLCSPSYLSTGSGTTIGLGSLTDMGGYFQGTITIQSYHEAGQWKVCSASLTDQALNGTQLSYYSFISMLNYSLIGFPPNYGLTNSGIPLTGILNKN